MPAVRLTARRTATAHPCMQAKAARRWSRGTARCGRRRAPRRRRSSGRRRRRPIAARTALRAAASAAARSRWAPPVRRRPRPPLPEPRQPRVLPPPPLAAATALPATGRKLGLVLFQALQRRCAAGRNARADLRIVGAAGAADRGNLRAGRLLRGRRLRPLARRISALRSLQPQAAADLAGAGFSRLGRRRCRRGRRFDGAHRALATRREARHVLLQALQRSLAARRHAGAMRHVIRAALRLDGVALRLARRLRKTLRLRISRRPPATAQASPHVSTC